MKNTDRKRAEKLLRELTTYEEYAEYYAALNENGSLPLRKAQAVAYRAKHYMETAVAIHKALDSLGKMERDVVTLLYIKRDMCVDDVCMEVAAERSTVYRYRASALDKIAKSVFWG